MTTTDSYKPAQSSFLAVKKDYEILTKLILDNDRVAKLLFYPSADALSRPKVSQEDRVAMLGRQIDVVPKLKVDNECFNYILILQDNFVPSGNLEFRNNLIYFFIVCHYTTWHLKDFDLRPYEIAGEIDALINRKHLSGIGELEFVGGDCFVLNDEFSGVSLVYRTVRGGDDKNPNVKPKDSIGHIEDFKGLLDLDS